MDWYWIFEDAKTSNLTRAELAEIETIIELAIEENNKQELKKLEEHNRDYPDNLIEETGFELQLNRFTRQYVPVINAKGQKEVWINFFCSNAANSTPWKSDILMVHDGGNCYFSMKVNLDTKAYYELSINGYA